MNHLEASNLLTHYVAGPRSGRLAEIGEHLAHCAECAGWVATCSLFSEALARHLASSEVASFALTPETLDAATRRRCAEHVARCRECHGEVELVREAALAARPETRPVRGRTWASPRRRWAAAAALAATVVLALGAVLVYRTAGRPPSEYVLAGSTVRGQETIVADHSITVEATEVAPGAALTLESEVVAFGDGFSVMTGGTLIVATSKSADHKDRRGDS